MKLDETFSDEILFVFLMQKKQKQIALIPTRIPRILFRSFRDRFRFLNASPNKTRDEIRFAK